ncbi:MAG: peptide deformylase [Bdellovibrionota bacterium]
MTVLKIMEWPASVLETKANDVSNFDDAFRKFVEDMHETMVASNGIGLAANQVNDLRRVLTICIPWTGHRYEDQEDESEVQQWWHDKSFTIVNPVITKKQGKTKYMEGCLSFPEMYDYVDRAEEVWVDYYDEHGEKKQLHANGLFAICIQHEIDHLDGIVFIERMSRLKANMIRKKMMKRPPLKSMEAELVE